MRDRRTSTTSTATRRPRAVPSFVVHQAAGQARQRPFPARPPGVLAGGSIVLTILLAVLIRAF